MNHPKKPVDRAARRDWLPYVAPMAAFLVLTVLEGLLPKQEGPTVASGYPAAYALKVGLVTWVAWQCRTTWSDLRPRPSAGAWLLSILLGLVVAAVWVGLDGRYPALPLQESRAGFDPGFLSVPWRGLFLAVRLYGLVVLVPLIEELFWRSFLIRWIVRSEFRAVPIGRVTLLAAVVTSVLFALAHPEWLPALLTGFGWAWLLRRTRSVAACVVSHLVANLALGLYILATGAWRFW